MTVNMCMFKLAEHFAVRFMAMFPPLLTLIGMDIKQGLSAVAAVTLGKDMTFRDYAQGAFRMRGIGKGQKVQVKIGQE